MLPRPAVSTLNAWSQASARILGFEEEAAPPDNQVPLAELWEGPQRPCFLYVNEWPWGQLLIPRSWLVGY